MPAFHFLKGIELRSGELLGIVLTTISGIFWGIYMVLAEGRTSEVDVLTRTTISMGLGSTPLLLLSMLTGPSWIYIVWLGVVNTALAFMLWVHSLEELKAFETSVLQNTMLIQIILLSMLFLGEIPSLTT